LAKKRRFDEPGVNSNGLLELNDKLAGSTGRISKSTVFPSRGSLPFRQAQRQFTAFGIGQKIRRFNEPNFASKRFFSLAKKTPFRRARRQFERFIGIER
jgi:hypothetical protein